ncbi:MAG TPA: cyclase family protein, partial [Planctomycetota bacterium]|nr:cyclase family protein [Planctomycetota bacterium]
RRVQAATAQLPFSCCGRAKHDGLPPPTTAPRVFMKLIDLSQPVYHESPNCPTHPPVRCEVLTDHPTDGWRTERLTLATHTGSHIDAPLHKVSNGAAIDGIAIESFVGPAYIADLRGCEPALAITPESIAERFPRDIGGAVALIATGWGAKRAKTDEWHYHSPRLTPEAAQWLVERGVRGVGIDHYSIGGIAEPQNSDTHSAILSAGVWILEDLRFPDEAFALRQPVTLWCLPFHLKGHSGAFCRPVLVAEI